MSTQTEAIQPQGQPAGTPRRESEPQQIGNVFAHLMPKMTPEEEQEERERIAARQAEIDADKRAVALKDWQNNCPPRIQTNDWQHPGLAPHLPHMRRVMRYQLSGQGVYAVGGAGKGKSRSVWWLARKMAVDKLIPTRYLVQTQVMNEINRSGLDAWLDKVGKLKHVPLLVWDDFGNFAAMSSRKEVLATEIFGLIDHRYHHNLPMLISSNARAEDLNEIFGPMRAEPIMRRLIEGCDVVDFDTKAE